MKIFKTYKTVLIAGVLLLASCAHENQPKESQFDYSIPVKTDLDKWIEKKKNKF